MTPDQTTTDVRETAELDDSSDNPGDWNVLPPEVRVEGDVPQSLIDVVEAAVDEHPNACDAPALWSPEEAPRDVSEHCVAVLTARYNEVPATDGNGEVVGWKPPYQSEEKIREVINRELGEHHVETLNNTSMGFYDE